MKRTLWILAAIGAALLAAAALRADEAAEKAAQNATRSWMALVDAGDYAESWKQAASIFRKQITVEDWEKAVGPVRSSLGKVESREGKSVEYSKTLPGAPDGEYVVVQYNTSFEKKKSAVETVTATRDTDGAWRVAGYFVR